MIAIIIVNWNTGSQLIEAVASIAKYHHNFVLSVIIVDNNSSDDSLAQVVALGNLPFNLQIIRNTENLGFGAACNQGVALANSEYLLFLNPDTLLFDNSITVPIAFMQQPENADVGIAGIQLVDENNHIARSCSRFPSVGIFFAQALGLNRLPGMKILSQAMLEWNHASTRQVDQIIGAFFLVRHSIFLSLGGFDERFFVYFEEVDYSFRTCQAGYRCVYLADAQAFHAGGGTSNQVKARRLFYVLRSRLLYAFKHFSWLGAVGVLLMTLLVEPLTRSVLAVFRRSWSGLKETWSGYGMLWRWLLERLRK